MRERERKTAEKYNVLDKLEELERQLSQLPDAGKMEFDLDGFYSDIPQVIILAGYDIPVGADDFYKRRRIFKHSVLLAAEKLGLSYSGDTIEDYGTSLYIVTDCDITWRDAIKNVRTSDEKK